MRALAFDVMAKKEPESGGGGESPMRASLQLPPGERETRAHSYPALPALRTTIAHSVTPKLAPFSLYKTGKTQEKE